MSATSNPIPPDRFAAAITELPLSSLFGKAAEIRNSVAHLRRSNEQMAEFVTSPQASGEQDTDPVLLEAIRENEEVIARMEERIALLKLEVEARGVRWVEPGSEAHAARNEPAEVDGDSEEGVHL